MPFDVAIIGCGIIGAAAAFELSKYDLSGLVLERENDVAMGVTRANSAIIHAGYDPEPGTRMAELNVRGNRLAEELCRDLSVPFERIGSLVLAFTQEDVKTLDTLMDRGVQNGVPGLRLLSGEEVLHMEPEVNPAVMAALYAPSAAIVNPWEYAIALAETAVRNGVQLRLNAEVAGMARGADRWLIHTVRGDFEARCVINAAGVDSDAVHDMVAPPAFRVKPSRGEYYLMDKCEGVRARHVLFQCPNRNGKGVLVAPTTGGNLIVGPNAEAVDDAHRVNNTARGMDFVRERAALTLPTIAYKNSIRNFAGIRANTDRDDFVIGIAAEGFIDLAGIKSPGLTAAPAIAREAAKLAEACGIELRPRKDAVTTREKLRFRQLDGEARRRLIEQNPLYGRVICRCETVTEGEIVEAIHSPIPPCSVDGVKRRAGTGMGRCQGGFCGPRVVDILCRELHMDPLDVLQDGAGSRILAGETKGGAQRA